MNLIYCPNCERDEIKARVEGNYECLNCGTIFNHANNPKLVEELRLQNALIRKLINLLDRFVSAMEAQGDSNA